MTTMKLIIILNTFEAKIQLQKQTDRKTVNSYKINYMKNTKISNTKHIMLIERINIRIIMYTHKVILKWVWSIRTSEWPDTVCSIPRDKSNTIHSDMPPSHTSCAYAHL